MSEEGYEQEFVKEAFDTNWISSVGPQVEAFEEEFAEYIGSGYATALSSGTAALHLALIVLGIKRGDRVICSSFTFAASANPIVYLGAEPVFIDSEPRSWNMDPALLEEELERSAKTGQLPAAVIAVDICGQSADYDPIVDVCAKFNVRLIEDAAEALGATYRGKLTGRFGDIAAFSFNGNKIITSSSGGMLVSDNKHLIEQARFLATQARDKVPHYQHSEIGYNYRLSNVLAGIGRGQLKVLDQRIARKRQIYDYYKQALADMPGIEFMPEADFGTSTHWLTCVTINPDKFGASREDVRITLEEHNIESRALWQPMHMQPVFAGRRVVGGSISEHLFKTGLCLPCGTAMTDDEMDLVCDEIRSIHKQR